MITEQNKTTAKLGDTNSIFSALSLQGIGGEERTVVNTPKGSFTIRIYSDPDVVNDKEVIKASIVGFEKWTSLSNLPTDTRNRLLSFIQADTGLHYSVFYDKMSKNIGINRTYFFDIEALVKEMSKGVRYNIDMAELMARLITFVRAGFVDIHNELIKGGVAVDALLSYEKENKVDVKNLYFIMNSKKQTSLGSIAKSSFFAEGMHFTSETDIQKYLIKQYLSKNIITLTVLNDAYIMYKNWIDSSITLDQFAKSKFSDIFNYETVDRIKQLFIKQSFAKTGKGLISDKEVDKKLEKILESKKGSFLNDSAVNNSIAKGLSKLITGDSNYLSSINAYMELSKYVEMGIDIKIEDLKIDESIVTGQLNVFLNDVPSKYHVEKILDTLSKLSNAETVKPHQVPGVELFLAIHVIGIDRTIDFVKGYYETQFPDELEEELDNIDVILKNFEHDLDKLSVEYKKKKLSCSILDVLSLFKKNRINGLDELQDESNYNWEKYSQRNLPGQGRYLIEKLKTFLTNNTFEIASWLNSPSLDINVILINRLLNMIKKVDETVVNKRVYTSLFYRIFDNASEIFKDRNEERELISKTIKAYSYLTPSAYDIGREELIKRIKNSDIFPHIVEGIQSENRSTRAKAVEDFNKLFIKEVQTPSASSSKDTMGVTENQIDYLINNGPSLIKSNIREIPYSIYWGRNYSDSEGTCKEYLLSPKRRFSNFAAAKDALARKWKNYSRLYKKEAVAYRLIDLAGEGASILDFINSKIWDNSNKYNNPEEIYDDILIKGADKIGEILKDTGKLVEFINLIINNTAEQPQEEFSEGETNLKIYIDEMLKPLDDFIQYLTTLKSNISISEQTETTRDEIIKKANSVIIDLSNSIGRSKFKEELRAASRYEAGEDTDITTAIEARIKTILNIISDKDNWKNKAGDIVMTDLVKGKIERGLNQIVDYVDRIIFG